MTPSQNGLNVRGTKKDCPPLPIRIAGRLRAADVPRGTSAGAEEENTGPCDGKGDLFVGIDETPFSTPRKSWWDSLCTAVIVL